jgi:hypothetical protein
MLHRRRRHIRAKRDRTYTVEQVARLYNCHKHTVRNWYRAGLQPIDDRRPMLFSGDSLNEFRAWRHRAKKRPCGSGELYCLPCGKPQRPAGAMAEIVINGPNRNKLRAMCPDCGRLIFQAVSPTRLAHFRELYDVADAKA